MDCCLSLDELDVVVVVVVVVGLEGDNIGSKPTSCCSSSSLCHSSPPDLRPDPPTGTPNPTPSPVPCMTKSSNNPVVGDSHINVASSVGLTTSVIFPVLTSVANSENFTDDPRCSIVMEGWIGRPVDGVGWGGMVDIRD